MSDTKNKGLEIELRVPKTTYQAAEPIEATLVLKNKSGSVVTVNKRLGINPKAMAEGTWEVRFDITFPPGERRVISTLINRGGPRQPDFAQLQPGEEITKSYQLKRFYWMELPGEYEIKATYHNSDDGSRFGLAAWTGEITSAPVKLKITT